VKPALAIVPRDGIPVPPPDRGRIMDATEVSIELLRGKLSPRSVRRRVPGKFFLGKNTPVWFEEDVRDWLRELHQEATK